MSKHSDVRCVYNKEQITVAEQHYAGDDLAVTAGLVPYATGKDCYISSEVSSAVEIGFPLSSQPRHYTEAGRGHR